MIFTGFDHSELEALNFFSVFNFQLLHLTIFAEIFTLITNILYILPYTFYKRNKHETTEKYFRYLTYQKQQ